MLIVTIVTGLVSGSYPAFFISSLQPIRIFKGVHEWGKNRSGWFRKILVVTQFMFTALLLVVSFTMHKQLTYMQNKDLGFNKDYIVHFPHYLNIQRDVLRGELMKYPGILGVTVSTPPSTGNLRAKDELSWSGKNPNDVVLTSTIGVDHEFLNTFQMKLSC